MNIKLEFFKTQNERNDLIMTKLLFEKTRNNTVRVKVNLGEGNNNSFRYQSGTRRGIRLNQGEDSKEYPYTVSYQYLDSFLDVNNIKLDDVEIDPNSIDDFYVYDNYTTNVMVNLTPAKVREWWNYDCPDLYRCMVNKEGHTNFFGMKLPVFQHKLVESSWNFVHIGEDIREDEVERLTKETPNTRIAIEMRATLKSRELSDEKIKEMTEYIDKYEEKIQSVINENEKNIIKTSVSHYLNELIQPSVQEKIKNRLEDINFPDLSSLDKDTAKTTFFTFLEECGQKDIFKQVLISLDGLFGLDCGWINIFTSSDSQYIDYKKLLKNLNDLDYKYKSDYLTVNLPIFVQSTTIQRTQFDVIQKIVEDKTGERLYAHTQLD